MISSEHLDMLLAFIMREHRMLKARETSFNSKELEEGEKLVRCAVKTVLDRTKKEGGFLVVLAKPTKRAAITSEAASKCKRLSRKQVKLIIENFATFNEAMAKAEESVKTKLSLPDPKKFDRFYEPKKHNYR